MTRKTDSGKDNPFDGLPTTDLSTDGPFDDPFGEIDVPCPQCGSGTLRHGYGLAGGGMGAYTYCTNDACDYFVKEREEIEISEPREREHTDSRGITYDSGPSNDPSDDGWG